MTADTHTRTRTQIVLVNRSATWWSDLFTRTGWLAVVVS